MQGLSGPESRSTLWLPVIQPNEVAAQKQITDEIRQNIANIQDERRLMDH